jgi:hypothetical protein
VKLKVVITDEGTEVENIEGKTGKTTQALLRYFTFDIRDSLLYEVIFH